jgi:hypothetical protein
MLCPLFDFPIPGSGSQGFRHGPRCRDCERHRAGTMLGKMAETLFYMYLEVDRNFLFCNFVAYKCSACVARGRY